MGSWVNSKEYINMTPQVQSLKDNDGRLLFDKAHTLMLVASIEALGVFVDNADSAVR